MDFEQARDIAQSCYDGAAIAYANYDPILFGDQAFYLDYCM